MSMLSFHTISMGVTMVVSQTRLQTYLPLSILIYKRIDGLVVYTRWRFFLLSFKLTEHGIPGKSNIFSVQAENTLSLNKGDLWTRHI